MNTLDRYLYRTVLRLHAMAMAVLLTLGALFVFISQQSDIGVGSYSAGDAFLFTLLNLPQQAFELLPIGAMIGALMGLGNLASGSELVVTRASGVSVWRIAWPVGLAGLTLALIMYGIGEYAAPPLAQFAKREKTTDKLADVSFAGSSSAWVKDGNLILRVQTGEVDRAFGGVSVFELDGPTRLRSIQRAERISVADPGRWSLHNVATSRFGDDQVEGDTVGETTMRSTVNPEFLGLAATDPQTADAAGTCLVHRSSAAQQSRHRLLRDRLLVANCQALRRDRRDPAGAALRIRAPAHHRGRNSHGDRRDARAWYFSSSPAPSRTAASSSASIRRWWAGCRRRRSASAP